MGYIGDTPRDADDILLLPRGVTKEVVQPLFIKRDTFLNVLKEQRGSEGMSEAILTSIMNAPKKEDYAVFSIIANNAEILQEYKNLLEGEQPTDNKNESNDWVTEFESALAVEEMNEDEEELLDKDNPNHEPNKEIPDKDSPNYEPNKEIPDEKPISLLKDKQINFQEQEEISLLFNKIELLTELVTERSNMNKKLLDSIVDSISNIKITDPVIQEANEEQKIEYTKKIDAFKAHLFSLTEIDIHLSNLLIVPDMQADSILFIEGFINILAKASAEDKTKFFHLIAFSYFGFEEPEDKELDDCICDLLNIGLSNYMFEDIDKVCSIIFNFVESLMEVDVNE